MPGMVTKIQLIRHIKILILTGSKISRIMEIWYYEPPENMNDGLWWVSQRVSVSWVITQRHWVNVTAESNRELEYLLGNMSHLKFV